MNQNNNGCDIVVEYTQGYAFEIKDVIEYEYDNTANSWRFYTRTNGVNRECNIIASSIAFIGTKEHWDCYNIKLGDNK